MIGCEVRDADLWDLIERYADGTLGQEETRDLEARLREESEVLPEFLLYMELQAQVAWDMRAEAEAETVMQLQSPLNTKASQLRTGAFPRPTHHARFWIAVSLLTVFFLGGLYFLVGEGGRPKKVAQEDNETRFPPLVGQVIGLHEVEWAEDARPRQRGSHLAEGDLLHLTAGLLEIKFSNGARVILQGPAKFRTQKKSVGRLDLGRLVARVPKPAVGFAVETATATITDLGTEFAIEVDNEAVDVLVFDGAVAVKPSNIDSSKITSHRLTAGKAFRMQRDQSAGTADIRNISPDDQRFASALQLAANYGDENTIVLRNGLEGYRGTIDVIIQRSTPDTNLGYHLDELAKNHPVIDAWGSPFGPDYATTKLDGNEPDWREGLLKFSDPFKQIPAGSQIKSAKLKLEIVNPWEKMNVHRMITPWTTVTANWDYFDRDSHGLDVGDLPKDGGGVTPGVNALATPTYTSRGVAAIDHHDRAYALYGQSRFHCFGLCSPLALTFPLSQFLLKTNNPLTLVSVYYAGRGLRINGPIAANRNAVRPSHRTPKVGSLEIDVTADVRAWYSNPATNHGWVFLQDDANRGQFVASEARQKDLRPALTIEFAPLTPKAPAF